MRVIAVNPGSSSVKLAVVEEGERTLQNVTCDPSAEAVEGPLKGLAAQWRLDAVGVRFVHGGRCREPLLLDEQERSRLAELTWMAPLHQPLSLALADLAARTFQLPVVACFDTAFHAQLPEAAARYALPRAWTKEYGLRRYGFHGLSCAYAQRRTADLLAAASEELQLVCCHIGAGVSVTAIKDRRSVDTSMGFTPLEGTVMSTRSGSVDPGLLLHLLGTGVTDTAGMNETLERSSGLAGMTGTSGDLRKVLALRAAADPDATLAVDVYLHRLRREIAAAAASLGRLDALVLTGGVAEHEPDLMGELLSDLGVLGIHVEQAALRASGDRVVSPLGASPRVLMLAAREELEIARQAELVVLRAQVPATSDFRP
ncbi:acetate kinase [Segniliparus rotundus DSM 44985]|uniref:Acetate kinase n=1 Tax=Segniliparus rotundus (strain ATCC BAA-972 / CDC 1076 / CIP 108378 / DSM 44985 / JCM 13578) TaxID=640132 RepID=D6ZAS6_SEGRD|nr:acetate kinase [Segniliparus rotundus]ADG98812.1 acetate kinase [Segniliparus rotundus DSM 44985]